MTIAWIALVLVVAFGALAFGWRSWLQWRRTGSTGFRGLSGRAGSAAWWGGVLLIVAFALSLAAPIVVLTGALDVWSLPRAVTVMGGGLFGAGIVAPISAQLDMGDSWRIGVDARESTELVSSGLFRFSRNPIFTSMLSFLAGLALLLPNAVSALAFLTALTGLELQVRLVEEPYLMSIHREAYARYAARVGRFLPFIGRMDRADSVGSVGAAR